MPKSGESLSDDERAHRLISISEDLQKKAIAATWPAEQKTKAIVVKRLVDYATFIAGDRGCAPGEIIWGSTKSLGPDHAIKVLAAIKVLGERAEAIKDDVGLRAILFLQAMTLLIHAENVAKDEKIRMQAMIAKHTLGSIVDELMKLANPPQA